MDISTTTLLDERVHTDSCSGGSEGAPRFALPGDVFDVAGDNVREAPGNNALYMSFLRGFPTLIRRPAVGVSVGFSVNGRDGGGMLFDAWLSAVLPGCKLLDTAGADFSEAGPVIKGFEGETGDTRFCGWIGGTAAGGSTSCN